ncbi:fibrobacter succinogenes major paralogous domain-containing protein [Fibrobacter sp.]|uniref:fibrobacter succinogenes major paralogous domain-containing protein n=1 Tax=Fibrobacter sp. TaxID=35828 RepID=UPI0025C3C958|nr:fibrobacter succinogenes major paralogous domain-containing protein [Fibrobacter sp.]MBR3073254.1 fibrobacter succinogenes major paralogous domain-containing protein [Fibrobacter sp.]
MTLKKLFVVGFVAAVLVACSDDGSSVTNPDEESSSSSAVSSSSVPEGYVDPSTVVKGTMTDERDGQTYKTVKIGTQTWMAENLNYAYIGIPYSYRGFTSDSTSWCYGNDPANCSRYGRLYMWVAAMDSVGTWTVNGKGCGYKSTCTPTYPVRGICPKGWHLPDTTEWGTLFTAVGGINTVGVMLKSASGWNDYEGENGNGSDAFAFSALPAGYRILLGNFLKEGKLAGFWSSAEYDGDCAYSMDLFYNSDRALLNDSYKDSGHSVRCVKD